MRLTRAPATLRARGSASAVVRMPRLREWHFGPRVDLLPFTATLGRGCRGAETNRRRMTWRERAQTNACAAATEGPGGLRSSQEERSHFLDAQAVAATRGTRWRFVRSPHDKVTPAGRFHRHHTPETTHTGPTARGGNAETPMMPFVKPQSSSGVLVLFGVFAPAFSASDSGCTCSVPAGKERFNTIGRLLMVAAAALLGLH